MTLKGFKAVFGYQLRRLKYIHIAMICYAAFTLLLLVTAAKLTGMEDMPLNIDGIDGFAVFAAAVITAGYCTDTLNTAAVNGVSRATAILSMTAYNTFASVTAAATTIAISKLLGLITSCENTLFTELMYGLDFDRRLWGESMAVIILRDLLILTAIVFSVSMIMMVMGAILYRLPKTAGIILCSALVLLICAAPAALMTYGEIHFSDPAYFFNIIYCSFSRVMGFRIVNGELTGNAAQGIAVMLLTAAVSSGISAAAVRNAAVKPISMRS